MNKTTRDGEAISEEVMIEVRMRAREKEEEDKATNSQSTHVLLPWSRVSNRTSVSLSKNPGARGSPISTAHNYKPGKLSISAGNFSQNRLS
jgi:hypothetical protein